MGIGNSVQLVILGLDSSGKTSILYRMKFDQYTNTEPTIGFNCEHVKITSGVAKGVTFVIWDIGGQDKTRPLWKSYLRSAEGVIFVLDSSDKERLEEARIELLKLAKYPDYGGLPILLLANKQDLPGSHNPDEIEKYLTLHELPKGQLYSVLPTCAVTGEGLTEAIDSMYHMIIKKRKSSKLNKRKSSTH